MKYLKYHKDYNLGNIEKDIVSSEMVSESLENDISWGGSLLGRLINSTIRKFKIGYNFTKIGNIVKAFQKELDELMGVFLPLTEDQKNAIVDIKSRFLLEEIYKEVSSKKNLKDKLRILLGDNIIEGLIDSTISIVEETKIDNKEELIEKLKKFKDDLIELKNNEGLDLEEPEEDEEESETDKSNPAIIFYKNSKILLDSICKIHRDIKNNTVKFKKGTTNEIKVGDIYDYIITTGENKGKKSKVMVVSLTNYIKPGPDKKFLTNDDEKLDLIEKDHVSVVKIKDERPYGNSFMIPISSLIKSGYGTSHEKTSTFFDEKKYQQQRTSNLQEIQTKISLAKDAVNIFSKKGNKERVNFYNNEINKYQNKLKVSNKNNPPGGPTETSIKKPDPVHSGGTGKIVAAVESISYINEEIEANLRDQESNSKFAWNKVVNAYNKSGISRFIPYIESIITINGTDKIKESKKKIMEIGRQVVINYSNIGKPISFDELISENEGISINDVAKSISLFARVLLAFSEDMGLLGSYGASYKKEGGDAGGAGNHIKFFINSFKKMKDSYPSIKKESIVNYKEFYLIREAESSNENDTDIENSQEETDQKDKVQTSWFKFFKKGEEKEWKVDEAKAKKLQEEIESYEDKEIKIDYDKNKDSIIRIINLFGKAYNIYATDYIPSGRPGGRISLKTMREYEHIGSNKSEWSADKTPGFGPWAAKVIYNKWQDGITKILEEKKYRKILANAKFVSEAESSTETPQKSPGSGKTLFTFINDLLDNNDGTFKKHRNIILKKYFGLDPGTINQERGIDNNAGVGTNFNIAKDDEGETDSPFFGPLKVEPGIRGLSKSMMKKIIRFTTSSDKTYIMCPYWYNTKNKYIMFRFQVSGSNNLQQSLVTDSLKGVKSKIRNEEFKTDNIKMNYNQDTEIFIGGIDGTNKDNSFTAGDTFKFKYMPIKDVNKDDFSNIKYKEEKIVKIDYLVVPTLNNKGDKQKLSLVDIDKPTFGKNDLDMKGHTDKVIQEFKK